MKKYDVRMGKYITKYVEKIDELLKGDITKKDIENHLIKINQFQHERLIHLIVLALTIICFIISALFSIIYINFICAIITLAIACFVIPYVYHYFILENCTQYMYKQYDQMIGKEKK